MLTTKQIEKGISADDIMLDLSDYAKKDDTATKIDLDALTSVVSNKLDITPQHRHDIEDIKELQNQLNRKYDIGTKYSYKAILSDPELIDYIVYPKVECFEITQQREIDGYKLKVDTNGDLMIYSPTDLLIASYSNGCWIFGGQNLKTFIEETNSVLQNHYAAIKILAQQHGLVDVDGNNNDTKITPGTN